MTRDLGSREVAGQDPANQETAVWDRRQYGTPRDSRETQTISGFGTERAGSERGSERRGSERRGSERRGVKRLGRLR